MPNSNSNLEAKLKKLRLMKEISRLERKNTNNTNNGWGSLFGSRKRTTIPAETNFYNKSLRRFFYGNGGFYLIVGLKPNGTQIRKHVPGLFYYKYDKKLGRIVPFMRRPPPGPRRRNR